MVVLAGQTAVGKTDVSLEIARDVFEIISSDSVQVYKYLNIGSGKVDEEVRKIVPHHLIDVVNPDYWFTTGDFCRRASKACDEITINKKIPLFAGGTGLYIDSFFKGISEIPEISDTIKKELQKDFESRGIEALYAELISCDVDFADKVHPNDKQRIVRGLEVFRSTGKPLSGFHSSGSSNESDDTLYVGLYRERDELRKRIDVRVEQMIESGFVDEVLSIRDMGYGPELKSMKSIGYVQVNKYLDNLYKLSDAVEEIKVETKRYAKRQMTWFKRNKRIKWFHAKDFQLVREYVFKSLEMD